MASAATAPRGEHVDDGGGGEQQQRELLVEDATEVVGGARTSAFRSYVARNGTWSIPRDENCCFSLVSERRTIDFYVRSSGPPGGGGDNKKAGEGKELDGGDDEDARVAMRWRDALRAFLDDFDRWRSRGEDTRRRKERGGLDPSSSSSSSSSRCNGDESPFEAARRRDLVALRQHFDSGCPVDRIDDATGDTVLLVACRLGFADVARLALVEYHGEWISPAIIL
jgi:hypothetical protein